MTTERNLLVAEDDESDVLLLQRAFKDAALANPVTYVHDGQAAIDFLRQQCQAASDHLPSLVLLDLKMPRRNGHEVLHWIRQQSVLRCLPVVIFSSSGRREDIETAYSLGACGFLVKPSSTVERNDVARFLRDWLRLNQPPIASTEGFKSAQSAHSTGEFDRPAAGGPA